MEDAYDFDVGDVVDLMRLFRVRHRAIRDWEWTP